MKRYLSLLALCLAFLCSCDQDTNFYVTPDVTAFVFGPEGGSFDDLLFTNGSWTCTVSDDAVTVTPMSGDFTHPFHVDVAENTEHYTKAIRIKFTASLDNLNRTGTVVVTQDCYPFIFCDEPVLSVGPEGGKVRFQVNSNKPWKIDPAQSLQAPSWTEPLSGGPNSTTVTLFIPANDEGRERTFDVVLCLVSDPSVSQTLQVVQSY